MGSIVISWPQRSKLPPESFAIRKKKRERKTKYTCPACGANDWAKPETQLI